MCVCVCVCVCVLGRRDWEREGEVWGGVVGVVWACAGACVNTGEGDG